MRYIQLVTWVWLSASASGLDLPTAIAAVESALGVVGDRLGLTAVQVMCFEGQALSRLGASRRLPCCAGRRDGARGSVSVERALGRPGVTRST